MGEVLSVPRNADVPAIKALGEYLEIAERVARNAGDRLAERAADWLTVTAVSNRDVKLAADSNAEAAIIAALEAATHLPIISEEAGSIGTPGQDGLRWVVDPLDGTANYSRAIPLYCVSLSLMRNEVPVLGVIYDFIRGETFTGGVGLGARLNGRAIQVSEVNRPERAMLATGLPAERDYSSAALADFGRSLASWHKVRMLGSAALSLAYVAAGRIDAYCEESIMIWDVAAGWAIVAAAGGVVRARAGAQPTCCDIAAANPRLLVAAFGE